ncbi:MAG: sodium:solute symporter family protein [Bacillaceae bacterium]|nr:sodium:solute symporter family protein [Bacillaceae bacterium]
MNQIQTYMWIGLIILIAITIWLGYLGFKRTKNVSDFAIAGGNMGPVILGLAFASTFFSAATFIGYTGWAYQWGFSSLWIYLALIGASPLGLILIAKKARELNIKQKSLSLSDWLGDRYNSDFLRVGTALISLFNIFYIAAQFAAGAWIFNTLLGLPYTAGLTIIALIVVLYTYGGGSYADIYTDAFQAVLMAIMGILVLVSGFWMIKGDGFTGILENLSANLSEQGEQMIAVINPESAVFYSVSAIIGAFIIEFAFSSQPQLFNKVLALKHPKDMAKMIIVYVLATICFLSVIFGGLYAAMFVPSVDHPDKALLEYVAIAFPPAIAAFLGLVVIAAAMSTTDGIFVVMSMVIANDIYRKFLVPRKWVKTADDQVEKTALKLSRWVTIVVGVIAYILVLNPPESMGTFIWIGISGVASGTLGPLIVGLFFPRRASAIAANISMISGVVSYLIILMLGFERSTMAAGAWAVCVGVVAMIIAGFFFPGEKKSESTV